VLVRRQFQGKSPRDDEEPWTSGPRLAERSGQRIENPI